MGNRILTIGYDDGHSEQKIVLPDGRGFRFASNASAGKNNMIDLQEGVRDIFEYYIPGEGNYIAGNIKNPEPTNFDDYPISPLNRVLMAYAFERSGIAPGSLLNIASCLPVSRYFIGSKPNKRLIQKKIDNLLKNDVEYQSGISPFVVKKHNVLSEAVAAWVDYVLERDNNGNLEFNEDLLKKQIAIVDWGGRTLDVAVVSKWRVDGDCSDSFDVGMLNIQKYIREAIYAEHEVKINQQQMTQILTTGKYSMFGKEFDAQEYRQEAESELVSKAKTQVKRLLGKGSDIDQILFVGGTSAYMEPMIDDWFPHQVFVKDPAFANARGLQKFAEKTSG